MGLLTTAYNKHMYTIKAEQWHKHARVQTP